MLKIDSSNLGLIGAKTSLSCLDGMGSKADAFLMKKPLLINGNWRKKGLNIFQGLKLF